MAWVTSQIEFVVERCCVCDIEFGVPTTFRERRRADKEPFYCPAGHSLSYTENEADRLRRDRDQLAQQVAQRDDEIKRQRDMREAAERQAAAAERQAAAARGQVTKLRKRASAGVCPCCNRTFTGLSRHMSQKHPEFVADAGGRVVPFKKAI